MSGSGDYISREAAIKRFTFATLDCLGMEPTIRASDVVLALQSIPAADVRPRWIPVTEQLIHSGWYLVACNEWGGSAVRKAIYDEATRKWLEFPCGGPKDITKFVTHWMPLPQGPEEEWA